MFIFSSVVAIAVTRMYQQDTNRLFCGFETPHRPNTTGGGKHTHRRLCCVREKSIITFVQSNNKSRTIFRIKVTLRSNTRFFNTRAIQKDLFTIFRVYFYPNNTKLFLRFFLLLLLLFRANCVLTRSFISVSKSNILINKFHREFHQFEFNYKFDIIYSYIYIYI